MRFDGRALIYAIVLEVALTVLAAFGGPHGQLGAVPWMLQLPGILVIMFGKGESGFVVRVATMFVVQVVIWYSIFAFARRLRRRRLELSREAR
jgi:hypothetical protein